MRLHGEGGLRLDASVVAIGAFDGVHRGHQSVIRQAVATARALGVPAVVYTFDPPPKAVFAGARVLTPIEEKLRRMAGLGVHHAVVAGFDRAYASRPAASFLDELSALHPAEVRVGADFRFGAGRKGDFAMLQAAGEKYGFGVEAMPTHADAGERVSSSAVRAALAAGQLDRAASLLGRPYSIAGRVVHGDKIGRTLGFPTANIQLKHRRPPLAGIYTVNVEGLGDAPVHGVASVGVRPTITAHGRPTLEVHLFDWHADCYGAHLRVHFLAKQRDEEKYDSLDALTAQIARDADIARAWFADRAPETLR